MALITIGFDHPINESVSVGDVSYYLNTSTSGAPTAYGPQSNIVEMGIITEVNRFRAASGTHAGKFTIKTNIPTSTTRPSNDSFILFSKDNRANMSSLAGYYAEVKMENTSNEQIELFSVGSEIVESSK